jgi:hypothetical protein
METMKSDNLSIFTKLSGFPIAMDREILKIFLLKTLSLGMPMD